MTINKKIIAKNYIKALKDSKNFNSESVFIHSYRYDIKNFEILLDQFGHQYNSKILWSNQSNSKKILAFGALLLFDFDGNNKNMYNDKIVTIIKNSQSINKSTQKNIPLLIGGQNFNVYKKNINIWDNFPNSRYLIPELLVYKENGMITINNFFEIGALSTEEIVNKILVNHDHIKTCNDNQSTYMRINKESKELLVDQVVFYNKVDKVKSIINDSSISKIVLSNAIIYEILNDGSYLKIFSQMEQNYPDCTLFFYDFGQEGKFIGVSPENIISKNSNTIHIDALAGSIDRGMTLEDEKANTNYLLDNSKINKEHSIVIKGIIESLDELNIHGIQGSKTIMKLKNILHLKTLITAKLTHDINPFHILDSLVPTPALSGYPKKSAIEKLQELEDFDRGWYSGALGWINLNMDYEFYAGLRSAFIKNNKIYIYAGAGIIIDSDAKIEWDEIFTKMKSIDEILNG